MPKVPNCVASFHPSPKRSKSRLSKKLLPKKARPKSRPPKSQQTLRSLLRNQARKSPANPRRPFRRTSRLTILLTIRFGGLSIRDQRFSIGPRGLAHVGALTVPQSSGAGDKITQNARGLQIPGPRCTKAMDRLERGCPPKASRQCTCNWIPKRN